MFRRFGLYVAALSLLSVAPHLRSVKAEDAEHQRAPTAGCAPDALAPFSSTFFRRDFSH